MDAIPEAERSTLYGIIFAAACDFSKVTRDVMRTWCGASGISEYQLWGKADLEDMLFQPKNDNLLFAYFGISLQIRKRSLKTELRSRTTIKRKLKRLMENSRRHPPAVMIRDPLDERYPYLGEENFGKPPEQRDNRWRICDALKISHNGFACEAARFYGFLDDDSEKWDCANVYNIATLHEYEDGWNGVPRGSELRQDALTVWQDLEEKNRVMIQLSGILPFDSILEVDEIGDDESEFPHIFVDWPKGRLIPFSLFYWGFHRAYEHQWLSMEHRIVKFPKTMRKPFPWEK